MQKNEWYTKNRFISEKPNDHYSVALESHVSYPIQVILQSFWPFCINLKETDASLLKVK